MTKRKGGKPDTRVTYSPEQTQRYKSQWSRYQKGLELARSNLIHKIDDETYRVPSERSPVGYWEIKKKTIDYVALGSDTTYATTYSGFNEVSRENFDSRFYEGLKTLIELGNIEAAKKYDKSYQQEKLVEVLPGGFPPQNYEYSKTFVSIDRSSDGLKSRSTVKANMNFQNDGQSRLYQTRQDYYIYIADPKPVKARVYIKVSLNLSCSRSIVIDPVNGRMTREGNYSLNTTYVSENDIVKPLILNARGYSIILELNIIAFNPGIIDINGTSSLELDKVEFLDATGNIIGGGYECDCPDFSKQEGVFSPPTYPSQSQSRGWAASEAGTPTWSDGKRRCYHIVGVQHLKGESVPVPTDFPIGSG